MLSHCMLGRVMYWRKCDRYEENALLNVIARLLTALGHLDCIVTMTSSYCWTKVDVLIIKCIKMIKNCALFSSVVRCVSDLYGKKCLIQLLLKFTNVFHTIYNSFPISCKSIFTNLASLLLLHAFATLMYTGFPAPEL